MWSFWIKTNKRFFWKFLEKNLLYFLDAVSLNGFTPKIDTEMGKAQWTIGPLCRYAEDLPLVFSVR